MSSFEVVSRHFPGVTGKNYEQRDTRNCWVFWSLPIVPYKGEGGKAIPLTGREGP
jgi:hypothetical protein